MTAGAERHFDVMGLDLTGVPFESPILATGSVIEPMTIDAVADYGRISARAYAGDHVDHEPSDDDPALAAQVIARSLRGDELGPWLGYASAHIRSNVRSIAAAIVISDRARTVDGPGGPWITDVFVDPTFTGQGFGSALITHAAIQLTRHGHTRLGLAVTHGNPAINLYERLGFHVEREVRRLDPDITGSRSRP